MTSLDGNQPLPRRPKPYFGKAYTLKPVATNRVANILIAQGFLVGSSRFQNEDVDYINRIILTRADDLADDVDHKLQRRASSATAVRLPSKVDHGRWS